MPYAVDETAFREPDVDVYPAWVPDQVRRKIAQIKKLEDPRSQGGKYREKWAYPTGKNHILAEIDDDARCIKLLKLIQLPS